MGDAVMRSDPHGGNFADLFYPYNFLERLDELASQSILLSLLKYGLLRHFAQYYRAFLDVSDAVTGLAFIVRSANLG
jgi:hypothetical protein